MRSEIANLNGCTEEGVPNKSGGYISQVNISILSKNYA